MNERAAMSRDALFAVAASLALAVFAGVSARAAEPKAPALEWSLNRVDGSWTLRVSGLNEASLATLRGANWSAERWQKLLMVHAEQGDAVGSIGLPAIVGKYRVEGDSIAFAPRFPLEAGINYVAVFDPAVLPDSTNARLMSSTFRIPAPKVIPNTVVEQVYPTADVLPENLLKFYVQFSGPMSRGHIYDHIHLRDEQGKAVELPFLEIDEELWNPEMTRLTLFIDPGRIKRGVTPLEEIGPALETGRRYSLVIDSNWTDAAGAPLRVNFSKEFKVGPPDREAIDLSRWKIQSPRADSHEPVSIDFTESLDHALALRMIRVQGTAGEWLPGHVKLSDHEKRWHFTPVRPWAGGSHQLLVVKTIEDLAGNNIGKSFEVDLFEGVQRQFTNATVRLPFEVR